MSDNSVEDTAEYQAIVVSISRLTGVCNIINANIIDEESDINILLEYANETKEAMNFIKTGAHIVSLSEFASMKSDLKRSISYIKARRKNLRELKSYLAENKAEIDRLEKMRLDIILRFSTQVIDFPKRT